MARKLPLLPTQFTYHEVPLGFDGLSLFVDGNSKITAENGTYDCPAPNAFSLPHIATCPGSTPTCREACYVHGLEEHAPAVYARYRENERTLHAILANSFSRTESAKRFGNWIAENCKGGFRWHVSGDVISEQHAWWIVNVCFAAPRVNFWIYTRSLAFVGILGGLGAPNLVVNVSADRDNYADALAVAHRYRLRLCYVASEGTPVPKGLREGDIIFPDYPLRGRDWVVCSKVERGECTYVGRGKEGVSCPECTWGVLEYNPTAHPFWQSLTEDQRKMICPADMFGQSDSYRCGKSRCSKCLVPAKAAP